MRYYVNIIIIIIIASAALSSSAYANNAQPVRIVVVGDTITASAQLTKDTAFTARLKQKLLSESYNVEIIDFTSPTQLSSVANARIDEILALDPDIVLLQLGFNDAIRGLDLTKTLYTALYRMVDVLKRKNIGVMLLGVKAPHGSTKEYAHEMAYVYRTIARNRFTLYPDILDSVTDRPDFTLADRMHPNENGVLAIVHSIYPYIEPLVVWRINLQNQ